MDGAAPDTQSQTYRFAFTGRAGEYFRIWIVSLCLSLLTLGIYSAWGKVRKRRYLQSHTRLDGDGIDYRASPLAVLRGRVLALVFLGAFALAAHFAPLAQFAFLLLLGLLSPWIMVAAARFNARNSTYRNVPFAFDGRVGEAARVVFGGMLLSTVSLGLMYPWYRMRRARFVSERHRFGATPFASTLESGEFFLTYLIAVLMVAAVAGVGIGVGVLGALRDPEGRSGSSGILTTLLLVASYSAYIGIYAYVRARTLNLVANALRIGPVRLQGTLQARRLAWLYLSNIVAILATLGLATPWATIRLARYRAECLAAHASRPLSTLLSGTSPAATATGSEVGDLFDVDVAL